MQGDVGEFGIGTLLSMFELEKKTGTFVVRRSGQTTIRLDFRDGLVVNAAAEGFDCAPGLGAFEALLLWREGRFEFLTGDVDESDTVIGRPSGLMATVSRNSWPPPAPRA